MPPIQSAFFGQGQQRLVYLRQIFVRWSHSREGWGHTPLLARLPLQQQHLRRHRTWSLNVERTSMLR